MDPEIDSEVNCIYNTSITLGPKVLLNHIIMNYGLAWLGNRKTYKHLLIFLPITVS